MAKSLLLHFRVVKIYFHFWSYIFSERLKSNFYSIMENDGKIIYLLIIVCTSCETILSMPKLRNGNFTINFCRTV